MSNIADIADEVALKLGVASLSMPVTPERKHIPTSELADLKTVSVMVMPGKIVTTPEDRGSDRTTYTIAVAVQKIVKGASDIEAIDNLMALCVEIADLFKRGSVTVPDLGVVPVTSTEIDPLFSSTDLLEHSLFVSIVTLTFLALR